MSQPLELWDLPDLEAAERDPISAKTTALRVGATLFSSMPVEVLLQRLGRFENLASVVVADDRVYDRDMPEVERRFRSAFPAATFEWHWDGIISGKHGR